jgi:hypothetical protein
MSDLKRLRDQEELPDALRDALRSLEQKGPNADTVARVQRSLEALPATAGSAALGVGWGKALGFGGLATLAVTTWVFVSRQQPQPNTPARPDAALVAPAPAAVPAVPPPASAPARASERERPAASAPAQVTPSRTRSVEPSRARAPERGARAEASANPGAATAPAAHDMAPPRAITGPAPSATSEATASRQETASTSPAAARPAEAQASQQLAPEAPPLPEPEDEASLLYRAKRIARTDPAAALRMLEAHAQHFPSGAFVEEREVLAIELHARLGHAAEAKRRAERFLARFPHSVYRSAVER